MSNLGEINLSYQKDGVITTAKINSLGAELVSLKKNGKEVIWEGDPKFWAGHAPVLFPFCGALKNDGYYYEGKFYNMPKHGFARKEMFELKESTQNTASFVLVNNEKNYTSFPFEFEFYINYTLTDTLSVEYVVKNNDEKTMYFTLGAHEGYQLNDDFENYSIAFDGEEDFDSMVLVNANLLKKETVTVSERSNELPLKYDLFKNDALVFRNIKSKKVYLKHKTQGKLVEVDRGNLGTLMFWTREDAPYICIECWSAISDYLDGNCQIEQKTDVSKLLKGEEKRFLHTVKPL